MIEFSTLTLVDYGVLLVLIVSCVIALLRGMTREFLGLLGWVVSVAVAFFVAPQIEKPINDTLNLGELGKAISWGIPFAVTVVLWFIFASLISPSLSRVGLGALDRWLGIIFGLGRGLFIVFAVFVGAVYLAEGEEKMPKIVQESHSTAKISYAVFHLSAFVPEEYGKPIRENISYRPSDGTGPISKMIGQAIDTDKNMVDQSLETPQNKTED